MADGAVAPSPGPTRGIRSLRARITLAASAVVAIVMAAGAVGFHAVLAQSLHDAAVRAAETRVDELEARVEAEGIAVLAELDDDIAQVVDSGGNVVAASDEAEEGALVPDGSGRTVAYDGAQLLLLAEDLDDDRTLLVGVPVDDEGALATVAALLAVSVPLVVVVVGGITWWVVGRSLRPVARIRAEVDRITADRLDRRVAVPESGDEIAALAGTMNRMLDRLDAAAAAQRRFVSDASHELRSPLATVRQHAELARAHPETTSVADLAGVVHDEGLRMQGLVEALLLLARLDEHAPLRRESVDLDDLALAEAARLRAAGVAVDARGIGAARVDGDPRLLAQVVRNLVDNAARHARSHVAIGVGARDGVATLWVDDDGDGVPPSERARVFDRFVRLDGARARDAGGSGLGLAIVRGIVEAEAGRVVVDDSPLGGARFVVTLTAAS